MLSLLARIGTAFRFGYDAVASKKKRRSASPVTKSEDAELTPEQRKKLIAAARDLPRNFAVAAWAIRRHLDYVSSFTFQAKTGNKELDNRIEFLMDDWGRRRNCEVTQRHRLARLIRMLECRRVVDGDCLLIKLADGRVQAIEGDRVQTPSSGLPDIVKAENLTHGVMLDAYGAAVAYAVCRREKSTVKFERLVPAENVFHHAYFERLDQVRGISPLAAAVNTFQDCYEAIDLTIAKLKVEQLFALALYRSSDDDIGRHTPPGDDEAEDESSTGTLEVDFGDGPIKLDLDKDDRAEFLQSQNPSSNSQAFVQTCIQIALKSLDIPYSFYAENFTNYSGQRQALLQYQQSANVKRQDNQELLDDLTAWKLTLWSEDGLLPGVDLSQVWWEWVPTGIPWIDPLKEIAAQEKALALRTTSRTRICRELGIIFRDLCDENREDEKYMTDVGLSYTAPVPNDAVTTALLTDREEQTDASVSQDR